MKIHLTGIGGVGMAGLAFLLKRRGHEVDGCDLKPTPRTRWLESEGIPVAIGHDAKHVAGKDLVIVTPAVAKDNPEYVAATNCRLSSSYCRLLRRGEVLAKLVSDAADSIAVCGSHGKTTTATFIAKLLMALGENVEWAIGGETGKFPVAGIGPGEDKAVLVVEADESDGTLELYHAKTLVVTNCEYDHPDHFRTREEYLACYERAKANAGRVILGERTNEETAKRVALARGYSPEAIEAAMSGIVCELPDRRFQKLAEGFYTDYGHHPTEVKYSLERARTICRGTLRVVFQPHRHSRTAAFLKEFAEALAVADEVVLCPVYAAFERPVEGGTSADLHRVCRERGLNVKLARSCEEAWEHALNSTKSGDLTMIQGAGDLLYRRGERRERKIWIGAGTNTVRSDLNLNVEYVKTEYPAGRIADREIFEIAPWMAGIPGTIGGWVKMNAGAHGHSISEVIKAVQVDGEWIAASDCGFGYRSSAIRGEIRDVRWVRRKTSETSVEEYLAKRRKFPAYTKGSVFKNPEGDFAGRLLEAAGCKSLRVGGAFVWEEHANVIVAPPESATASDFLALAEIMRERVYHRFGVMLEYEVTGLESEDGK